jgi:hypothetical protein
VADAAPAVRALWNHVLGHAATVPAGPRPGP